MGQNTKGVLSFSPTFGKMLRSKTENRFFRHLCGKNEVETESGNLSSEFLGINRKTGEKVVMYTGDTTKCLIELRKRQGLPCLGHHFKSDILHQFALNACEVQRFRRLSYFGTRASMCEGCTGFLPSLASSTDNPWSAVSASEIGDIPAVLSVS